MRRERVEVGDTILINGFKPDRDGKIYQSEAALIGKTGVVERIGCFGELYGTWGPNAILPTDEYEVVLRPVKTYSDVVDREG